jgi:hypothetical protein
MMRKNILKYIMGLCLCVQLNVYGQMQTIDEAGESQKYIPVNEIVRKSEESVQRMLEDQDLISVHLRERVALLDRSLDRSGSILRAKLFICGALAMCVIYKIRSYVRNKRAKRKEEVKKEAHGQANR